MLKITCVDTTRFQN
uniref:BLTX541 n=1 Tax=Nephila pilipes TaxID=299642 RepID=A0A076KU65_NEPPI|nr:BLTX541 [Nephila pilipes]